MVKKKIHYGLYTGNTVRKGLMRRLARELGSQFLLTISTENTDQFEDESYVEKLIQHMTNINFSYTKISRKSVWREFKSKYIGAYYTLSHSRNVHIADKLGIEWNDVSDTSVVNLNKNKNWGENVWDDLQYKVKSQVDNHFVIQENYMPVEDAWEEGYWDFKEALYRHEDNDDDQEKRYWPFLPFDNSLDYETKGKCFTGKLQRFPFGSSRGLQRKCQLAKFYKCLANECDGKIHTAAWKGYTKFGQLVNTAFDEKLFESFKRKQSHKMWAHYDRRTFNKLWNNMYNIRKKRYNQVVKITNYRSDKLYAADKDLFDDTDDFLGRYEPTGTLEDFTSEKVKQQR